MNEKVLQQQHYYITMQNERRNEIEFHRRTLHIISLEIGKHFSSPKMYLLVDQNDDLGPLFSPPCWWIKK